MPSILIVDDNTDWLETVSNLLKVHNENYYLTAASSEAEATTASRIKFDLAIIDLRLHGDDPEDESGLNLATTLRVIQPNLKMILLATQFRSSQIVRALKFSGFADFVEKSEISKLLASVDTALSEPSYIRDTNQLSLSIENNQPVWLRARGSYIISARARGAVDIPLDRYDLLAEKIYGVSNPRGFVKEVGSSLYEKIFENDSNLLRHFNRVEEAARREKKSLNICFEISRDLIALPLEFMFTDAEYLILKHPVTRFITEVSPDRPALSPEFFSNSEKIRVLLVGSNTLPPINGVDDEINQLSQFFKSKLNIELNVLPTKDADFSNVEWHIKNWQPDIIHYAGHGLYEPDSPEQSALFFWSEKNREGNCLKITADKLMSILRESTARFVYLSCCYGSTTGVPSDLVNDDFLGIADAVIQAGIPSVLGFRWPLSDTAAPLMAENFYNSLLNKGSLRIAMLEARRKLANYSRDDFTWLSPILIHQA